LKNVQAEDLHLLAVVRHKLQEGDPEKCYEEALERYDTQVRGEGPTPNEAMHALCRVDYGQYLLDVKGKPEEAARQFQTARSVFGDRAPPPFRVYCYCREAEAWQRLGRWKLAEKQVQSAVEVSQSQVAFKHPLTAHAIKTKAWIHLEQWEIGKADDAFRWS